MVCEVVGETTVRESFATGLVRLLLGSLVVGTYFS